MKLLWKIPFFLLAALVSMQYFLNVKYDYPARKPFAGNFIYNPYFDLDTSKWELSNFHIHVYDWGGITSGSKNNVETIDSLYNYLGYNFYSISNYEDIYHPPKAEKEYLPVYEHGYMPWKNHQLVLNAKHVCWQDYLFPETLDNKQNIINDLKKDSSCLVAIAHPCFRNSYKPEDFCDLCNYDFIEVLSKYRSSIPDWDSALSSGKEVFLLAGDDTHDVADIFEGARFCTYINAVKQRDSLLKALKAGCAYGVDIDMEYEETYDKKKKMISDLPRLDHVSQNGDTLTVAISKTACEFKFIGQNGSVKQISNDACTATYIMKPDDSYIRTEIKLPDKSVIYLNPVFRYNGDHVIKYYSIIDYAKTWTWRAVSLLTLGALMFFSSKRIRQERGI